MKKLLFLVSILLPLPMFAAERSVADAAAVAAEFMNEQYAQSPIRKASCASSSFILSHTRAKLNSESPAFYVFNKSNKDGYVIVSADDRTEDVLVYSEQGNLDMDNINPNFAFWLGRLQEEISAANDENTYTAAQKKARKATTATAISPLLVNSAGEEIAWYQEEPYWNQCPMDLWKTSERCLTGCVATAAAQIMYKWRYPEKGTGSHSYTWECCMNSQCSKTSSQTLSKDFSTVTFDWDNMLANYNSGKTGTTAQKNAVAELMYCCGVACDMEYGGSTIGGSGAWTDDMGYGMTQYFGYKLDKFITTYKKSDYQSAKGTSIPLTNCEWSVSTNTFTSYFNTELEAGRPILMGGEDSDGGGHEFVCDGRNTSGYFHINWGWEGDGNNYCLLSALKPSGNSYNFSSEIDALIGLEPAVVDTVHVTGVTVSPTTLTLKQKEKKQLSAIVAPNDATVKTVTWSSSNNAVATVSATGQVIGVSQGSATITATTKDGQKMATCAVTVTNEIIENTAFELITNISDLSEGMEALIVCRDKSKALSSTQNDNNRGSADVTISQNMIELEDDQTQVQVLNVVAGTKTGTFAFSPSEGKYLYAASSTKNYLKTQSSLNDNASFAITISSGDATMTAQGTNTHNIIRYNPGDSTNPRLWFSCYGSSSTGMLSVSIFARESTKPTDIEQITMPTSTIQSTKFIIDGQLYIQMGEHWYNAQGNMVK